MQGIYSAPCAAKKSRPLPVFSSMPRALIDFTLEPGSVSEDGQTAVMTVNLTCQSQGATLEISAYPLHLLRENGLWKIDYQALKRMMEAN